MTRVLDIDNEAPIRLLCRVNLEAEGMSVLEAGDGPSGLETARTVGAGATGLGLFLAEGLVTAMGGRIWVDSDEGRGATFVFELPAAGHEN
jgi:sensor histidine kinase regulating citrate/malate metabolism